jgi:cathepsin B
VPIKPSISAAEAAALPTDFDGRTAWPNCPSVSEIRDQANCGSCWAFGAVSAITDRYCIQKNQHVHVSAEDMNSCCQTCGYGCEGGYPDAAWQYWVQNGLVDGGNYDSKDKGCAPYSLPNCDHHCTGKYGPCPPTTDTPACPRKCIDGSPFAADKHYGAKSYGVSSRAEDIKNEIMNKGPVEAAFTVYEDFLAYKSGVYKHTTGRMLGGHAIKLLGWGVQGSDNYWIAANSWNEGWGDNGYFKIGFGQCGIENRIVAGDPK